MIPRYFGMDIHRNYAIITAVDEDHQVVYGPQRVQMADLQEWAAQHLTAYDQVALEVTANAWQVVDCLATYAGKVLVANPYKTRLIAEAHIKSDKVDALALARLLAARFICTVWVPEAQVRQHRALAKHRANLQKQGTRVKNRLHSILHRHNLQCPEKSLFTTAGRAWLRTAPLPMSERLEVRHLLAQLGLLEEERDEVDRLIARLACDDPRIPRLMQVTGIGYYSAFAALAVIGNIQRFASPHKLAAYAGLVPSLHQSGQRTYYGHLTKTGNQLLRWLMVEAARSAVRYDAHWQQVHDRIARRRGTNIATVAVARKLLVTIWYLLTNEENYYYLRTQTFVTKLQEWAYRIGRSHLPATSSKEFVYDHLTSLGLDRLADSLSTRGRKGRLCVESA